jgi:hypothetical protein
VIALPRYGRYLLSLLLAVVLQAAMQGHAVAGDGAPAKHTPVVAADEVRTPEADRRAPDQTLLTYPEWFLVFSPYEYGEFIAKESPSDFPFLGHIGQFWLGYKRVYDETRARQMPPNPGYHLMIWVIGTSTTVEYAIRSVYENSIGRLAKVTAANVTEEERYATAVAQDYVRFIRVRPWYEYEFKTKLKGLWEQTALTGPDMIRKWERKFALSTEYLAKMLYGKLIRLGTAGVYDPALPSTVVLLQKAPKADAALPDMKLLKTFDDGAALVRLPRYEPFMKYAKALAEQGVAFQEIAGNTGVILVSVLVLEGWKHPDLAQEIFAQPILTRSGISRRLLIVPVADLSAALHQWSAPDIEIEHVFDF